MSASNIRLVALAAIIPMLILIGQAGALTAVLSGSCTPGVSGQTQYVNFSVYDSGNASVTNMVLDPNFVGLNMTGANSISLVAPGNNYSVRLYVNGTAMPGSYAGAIIARYTQGPSVFFASFPCLASFGSYGPSQVSTVAKEKGNRISGEAFNIGSTPLNVSVYMFVPPEFSVSPSMENFTIGPDSEKPFNFTYSKPNESDINTSFALGSSYIYKGEHYAVLSSMSINLYKGANGINLDLLVLYVSGGIIAALIALIAYSVLSKRRRLRGSAGV